MNDSYSSGNSQRSRVRAWPRSPSWLAHGRSEYRLMEYSPVAVGERQAAAVRSVALWDQAVRVVRLLVAVGRLALGQFDFRLRYLLVRNQAQEVGDAVQPAPAASRWSPRRTTALRACRWRQTWRRAPGSSRTSGCTSPGPSGSTSTSCGHRRCDLQAPGLLLLADFEPVLDQDDAGGDHRALDVHDVVQETRAPALRWQSPSPARPRRGCTNCGRR